MHFVNPRFDHATIRMKVKIVFLFLLIGFACRSPKTITTPPAQEPVTQQPPPEIKAAPKLVLGAEQLDILLSKLQRSRVALVVNQTSIVGKTHLADTLKSLGVNLVKIFGPEHGFRGAAADGEYVKDAADSKTGLRVVSLYGKNYKPTPEQLSDVDIVVFDIQDVGTRFYTYISTMHYMMEACAEQKKKMIILDRPNPNAYIDGPINLYPLKSLVAMHTIPITHGLTVGELAKMINGEGWLANHIQCEIEIIPLKNWKHTDDYSLPVRPSPNLPNDQAIRLYPSICLFEGTVISVGRGTQIPFQILGNPELKGMPFQFTPVSIPGMSTTPPLENKLCYGLDLRNAPIVKRIDLSYVIKLYKAYPDKEKFFVPYFDTLAGTTVLKQQIKDGLTEDQIRETWKPGLEEYKKKREKYLLYP
jgi:uncharacterized protein YbbC (DUF1343 family)